MQDPIAVFLHPVRLHPYSETDCYRDVARQPTAPQFPEAEILQSTAGDSQLCSAELYRNRGRSLWTLRWNPGQQRFLSALRCSDWRAGQRGNVPHAAWQPRQLFWQTKPIRQPYRVAGKLDARTLAAARTAPDQNPFLTPHLRHSRTIS